MWATSTGSAPDRWFYNLEPGTGSDTTAVHWLLFRHGMPANHQTAAGHVRLLASRGTHAPALWDGLLWHHWHFFSDFKFLFVGDIGEDICSQEAECCCCELNELTYFFQIKFKKKKRFMTWLWMNLVGRKQLWLVTCFWCWWRIFFWSVPERTQFQVIVIIYRTLLSPPAGTSSSLRSCH